jgi:hypothetical protein
VSLGAFLGAVEVELGSLGGFCPVEWGRGVDWLAVWLVFVGEFWEESLVRCGAGRTAWGLTAAFGVGRIGAPEMVMGVQLKVACSEVPSRLGMRRRTSRLGLSFSVSTEVGAVLACVAARVVRLVVLPHAAAMPRPAEGFTAAAGCHGRG